MWAASAVVYRFAERASRVDLEKKEKDGTSKACRESRKQALNSIQ